MSTTYSYINDNLGRTWGIGCCKSGNLVDSEIGYEQLPSCRQQYSKHSTAETGLASVGKRCVNKSSFHSLKSQIQLWDAKTFTVPSGAPLSITPTIVQRYNFFCWLLIALFYFKEILYLGLSLLGWIFLGVSMIFPNKCLLLLRHEGVLLGVVRHKDGP